MLLQHGADVNALDGRALVEGIRSGQEQLVRLLLDNGADVHAGNDRVVWMAAHYRRTEIVLLLLSRGADACGWDSSAVDQAVANGDMACLRLLLDHGARIRKTLLMAAVTTEHVEIIQLLLERAGSLFAEDRNFGSARAMALFLSQAKQEKWRAVLQLFDQIQAQIRY
ncbi:hypothetical protein HDU93_005379 [Gonapodya sp. JEL0774]|nr:hypothetical protein HDU93_005379 [Gonapodya sp. JEL0774]